MASSLLGEKTTPRGDRSDVSTRMDVHSGKRTSIDPTDEAQRWQELEVHAPPCQVPLEGARGFFFDLRPGRIGDGRELAVQVIHAVGLL